MPGVERRQRISIFARLGVAIAWLMTAPAAITIGYATEADTLSSTERTRFEKAFKAADTSKWTTAFGLVEDAEGHLLTKVLRWQYMTRIGNRAGFSEISEFIDANPDWPFRFFLRRSAEDALAGETADTVLDWLNRHPPVTPAGRVALVFALDETGRKDRARALAREVWIQENLRRDQEKKLFRRFRSDLRPNHHWERLDRLVWEGRYNEASRMLPRVTKGLRDLARARMLLARQRGGVDAAIERVPASLRRDPGLRYERTRWRRRKGKIAAADQILRDLPLALDYPEKWWVERAIVARRHLLDGRMKDAYRLVADHGLWPGSRAFAHAEWMTGWLALRFVERPADALLRFERLHASVQYPISRARAAYWAGRAAAALDDRRAAADWFTRAARFDETFYGQLARRRLHDPPPPAFQPPSPISAAHRAAFERDEIVRAARLLHQIGRDGLVLRFIRHFARLDPTQARLNFVAVVSREVDRPDIGVRIGRLAYRTGVALPDAAYPVIDMPKAQVEPALMLAMSRQESNFAVGAVSHAGARGIMQIMPFNARAAARKLKLPYSRARLTTDAAYNIRLATAHLSGLLERYDNDYVLAITAYNAGRRAVSRWVKKIGDPRDPKVDVVDWIELVPFSETRNYVQRVLEGLEIYREKLGSWEGRSWLDATAADGGVEAASEMFAAPPIETAPDLTEPVGVTEDETDFQQDFQQE